eukprot:1482578-Pleurochrysis_carterae.AAC.1
MGAGNDVDMDDFDASGWVRASTLPGDCFLSEAIMPRAAGVDVASSGVRSCSTSENVAVHLRGEAKGIGAASLCCQNGGLKQSAAKEVGREVGREVGCEVAREVTREVAEELEAEEQKEGKRGGSKGARVGGALRRERDVRGQGAGWAAE